MAQALEAAGTCQPDLVVMGARLPDGSGVAACREIRAAHPATRVVILTGYADPGALLGSVLAGASGYLLKQSGGREPVAALEAVGRGESLFDPALTEQVRAHVRRTAEVLLVAIAQDSVTSAAIRCLNAVSQGELDAVAAELNGRPRQTLGWRSPSETFAEWSTGRPTLINQRAVRSHRGASRWRCSPHQGHRWGAPQAAAIAAVLLARLRRATLGRHPR